MAAISQQKQITANLLFDKPLQNRCPFDGCGKKLGLIPFKCRCEKEFCGIHRMPEKHSCSFDYKTLGRLFLEENNKKISFEKVIKI